jgi:ankyrin repeat protein
MALVVSDEYEPNPDYAPPKAGEPPLHRAARCGDHDAVRSLVAAGADVNAVFDMQLDPGGPAMPATPLLVAAGSGDGAGVDTVELLLKLGAAPRQKLMGRSAARFACKGLGFNYRPGGDASRLRRFLELGCDPDETWHGITLVADAAWAGDPERVRVLLAAGANPDPPGIEGGADHAKTAGLVYYQIPVFLAALEAGPEMIRMLLDAGADAHVTDKGGHNALSYAASADMALLLAGAGVDLEAPDEFGWTPLVGAMVDGNVERAAGLLAAGANVRHTHDRGYTVFMSAVSSPERSIEMMRLIIGAGAEPHAVTELGWNAFHAAVDVNGYEANTEESVRGTLEFLHRLGVDINHRDSHGATPLTRARASGTPTVVRILQELGAQ